MSIPQRIRDLANKVRNEIYGKDVRESIAESMEVTGEAAEEAKDRSVEAHDITQNLLDESFDSSIINQNFEQRLDDEIQQMQPELNNRLDSVDTQLAQRTYHVTPEMFGAKGDGIADDSQALYDMHDYANNNNLNVMYNNNSYLLGQCLNIPIKTNTDFKQAKILIDESKAKAGWFEGYYFVEPSRPMIDITNEVSDALIKEWKPGRSYLPSLSQYDNYYINVENEDTLLVKRSGGFSDYILKDQTVMSQGGLISSEICHIFTKFTKVQVKYAESSYITIEGGTFEFNGESSTLIAENEYKAPVFQTQRCKVIFKNMVPKFKDGVTDISTQPNFGLIRTKQVTDVKMENIPLLARKVTTQGTYGLRLELTINLRLVNVKGSGEGTWGVTETEHLKDFYVYNCNLSRLDAHVWGYNWNITDSILGEHGMTLHGGGDLNIENTTMFVNENGRSSFVGLRADYGGTWDGDLTIKNGKMVIGENNDVHRIVMSSLDGSHDYHQDIVPFRSVDIDGFEFIVDELNDAQLYGYQFNALITNDNLDLYLPDNMSFKDIRVKGRKDGINVFSLNNTHKHSDKGYGKEGDAFTFEPNAEIEIENVDTIYSDFESNYYGLSITNPTNSEIPYYFPEITVKKCKLNVALLRTHAKMILDDSIVSRINTGSSTEPIVVMKNSQFKPDIGDEFILHTGIARNRGHLLIENTVFHHAIVDGVKEPVSDMLVRYSIFLQNKFDGWIKNCRFSHEIWASQDLTGFGERGVIPHQNYVTCLEKAEYRVENAGTVLNFNDDPPMDGLFHRTGDFIYNPHYNGERGSVIGWRCISSGVPSESNSRFAEEIK